MNVRTFDGTLCAVSQTLDAGVDASAGSAGSAANVGSGSGSGTGSGSGSGAGSDNDSCPDHVTFAVPDGSGSHELVLVLKLPMDVSTTIVAASLFEHGEEVASVITNAGVTVAVDAGVDAAAKKDAATLNDAAGGSGSGSGSGSGGGSAQ